MNQSTQGKQPVIPAHVAIIMDGNRRWAREKGKNILAGHKFVVDELLERLVEHAADRGIKYITFWVWSTENWKRTAEEVTGVMQLFKHLLGKNIDRLHKKGVRIQTIGNIDAFPKPIIEGVKQGVEKTKNNQRITAIFALNYGGRDEIIRGMSNLFLSHPDPPSGGERSRPKAAIKNATLDSSVSPQNDRRVTKETFGQYLDTSGIPDPDLIIRTGGDKRLSGFMLWQCEYSELYFTDTLMPDFTPDKLDEALADFAQRKRRFGK